MKLTTAVLAVLAAALCGAAAAHDVGAPLLLEFDKAAQRQAGVRTVRAAAARELMRLPATVVADPRRQLRIAALQDGVVEPAGAALPLAGQQVRAGQLLAWLRPLLTQPERRDLDVDVNNARRDVDLGRLQIDRYGIDENQHLEIQLPTPSIEIVSNYRSAVARNGELSQALQQPIPLLAPRAGTVLRSPAVAGRIAAAGETLFELDAAGGLAAAAEFGDDDVDAAAAVHAVTPEGRTLALHLLGLSADPALRSRRALYALDDEYGLSVNQPLLIEAPRAGGNTVVLPRAAVFRHDGRSWVWLHPQAEQFVARPVQVGTLDAEQARIDSGVDDGERVVTQGTAALLAAAQGPRAAR